MVNIYNTNDQIIEKFITEGEIDKIDNYELIEIKRRTQTIFSIPYLPEKMLKSHNLTYKTDYYIILDVFDKTEFDKIKGFSVIRN